ncbi:hypothetical protein TNCV_4835361 [Trichonephila clavipes]|nr:hypothetical protein TNCV_4835361 [Trichonephila clavipes]
MQLQKCKCDDYFHKEADSQLCGGNRCKSCEKDFDTGRMSLYYWSLSSRTSPSMLNGTPKHLIGCIRLSKSNPPRYPVIILRYKTRTHVAKVCVEVLVCGKPWSIQLTVQICHLATVTSLNRRRKA